MCDLNCRKTTTRQRRWCPECRAAYDRELDDHLLRRIADGFVSRRTNCDDLKAAVRAWMRHEATVA